MVAECCWVLQSKRYGYTPKDIANKLNQLVSANGIKTREKEIVALALVNYGRHTADFVDTYLGTATQLGDVKPIITWNAKDFDRLGAEHYPTE